MERLDMVRTIYEWMTMNLPARPLIYEIGAHHCEDTLRFFELFPRARIMAWEPDPRNIQVIRATKQLHDGRAFSLVEAAAGDHDGETLFYLSGGTPAGATGEDRNREWTYSSSIRKPKEHLAAHPTVAFVGECWVRVQRLDSVRIPVFAGEAQPTVDFIWADVQGAEADMIRGGQETLKRTKFLFTEFNEREMYEGQVGLNAIAALLPPGFVLVRLFDDNALFLNTKLLPPRA